ncbi:diaminohydroxyphosphoribosylaminopyrimidine deaminase [Geminocystis sp. NIES-3708]|uniref:bifunctional diaminohydroxyphosphoribosylaminopyrimidine deaminase/5-amino-6-(5-phosphoribosylamino)uracil reductase RibD n=1 Tax=Geminocystis sp. NIES-3708 TaxID=1615909 RepID=UPI0005FC9506|nr:bifunctional diaminohydroxyphosphoribosylaminopyrimidine deaminase/5-amino-6-(5-phosphoribosylamino)uracil reductase RibD [Geminocystis sp. NIES-3708]BAQ60793.1 diaminohydroxyphosphoribosylaminopyrimidine deaminase [Geminocystis sp. NIES-3708]
MSDFDSKLMERCLELAKKAQGKTSPNPLVGAVIVKDGKIIGEGFHPQLGQPHAEIFALQEAGLNAENAIVYVNLEPCNHFGRTPPCTEALIRAKVKQVVVGMIDPDSRVSGSGIQKLISAGIDVRVGIEEDACMKLNEAFIHRVKYQQPFGILKYAMTLDGKIATDTGHSQWITGTSSRNFVHHLRSSCDAVIIGGNTVRRDNPQLTTHGVTNHNPLRVVMTKTLNLPLNCQLWDVNRAETVIFTIPQKNTNIKTHLLNQGVEIVEIEDITPSIVMKDLYQRGLNSVLWECGGNLASQAIASGNIQKIYAFIAPKIIGGNNAPTPIGDLGTKKMNEAFSLNNISIQQIDGDFLIEGYLGITN